MSKQSGGQRMNLFETIDSSQVGGNVKDVQVGDHVGIGYFIDSCLACQYCKADEETLCEKGTYSKYSLLYHSKLMRNSLLLIQTRSHWNCCWSHPTWSYQN